MLTPTQIETQQSFKSIKSNKEPAAAGIDPQVQSLKFEDIRAIPTGGYIRNPIVEKHDNNETFATMNRDQIDKRIRKNFKGIFQDIPETDKLPKLFQQTQTKLEIVKSPFRSTSLDMKTRIIKAGNQTVKHGNNNSLSIYSSAQKQIRENMQRVAMEVANRTSSSGAALKYQKMIFNRSNEFANVGRTTAGSGDPTSPGHSNSNLGERKNNFATVQGMINQASDELTNASLIGNTLAGAKNTKYKAQFRLNQNSQTARRTEQKSPFLTNDMENFDGSDDVPFPHQTFGQGQKMDDMNLNASFLNYNPIMSKTTQVNAIDANINSVRDFKTAQLEQYKDEINKIHSKLMKKQAVSSGGNANITQIQKLLAPKLKDTFLSQQGMGTVNHNKLFKNMNCLNGAFLDIIDSVCSFKVDLGIMLQKLVESYNSVFLQQYDVFYHGKLQKEKELDAQILIYQKKQDQALKEQEKLIFKQEMAMTAIQTKDQEIARLLETQNQLEKQIEDLKQIIHKDEQDGQETEKHLDDQNAEINSKPFMVENYDRKKRQELKNNPNSYKLLLDPANIDEFEEALQLMKDRHEDRNDYVVRIYQVIQSMLTSQQSSVKCQTDQACMNNAIMYDYYSYGGSSDDEKKQDEDDPKSQEYKFKKLVKEKGIHLDESGDEQTPYEEQKSSSPPQVEIDDDEDNDGEDHDVVAELDGAISKSQLKQTESAVSLKSKKSKAKLSDGLTSQGSKSKISKPGNSRLKSKQMSSKSTFNHLDVPVTNFNKTMRQIGIQNANKLKYLHDQLEQQVLRIKRRKILENNEDPTRNAKHPWKIPYNIIAFIQNRIFELEDKPQIIENYELLPWHQFREILFDIYDHRIKHAAELNGAVNTNYCALNEHIVMFFVEKCKKRHKAEEKIVDLIINLRYYYDFWQRAKMFAWNLELVQISLENNMLKFKQKESEENGNVSENDEFGDLKVFDQPHAYLKDQEVSDNDIYTQEFFLYAYSLLSNDRPSFEYSGEGMTYVRLKHHDKAAKEIMDMLRGPCGDIQKWTLKVRRMVRRLPSKATGQDGDYLDLDMILSMLTDEFKNQRRLYQRDLQKQFMRQIESNQGPVELETFEEIINSGLPPNTEGLVLDQPVMVYPTRISQIRAYIYSCTSGDNNTNVFTDDQFLAGCNRYAIENPFPTISLRCGLYGNSKQIMEALEDAAKKLGKSKIDPKIYTSSTMGLPEPKEKSKQIQTFSKMQTQMTSGAKDSDDEDIAEQKRKPTVEVHETPRRFIKKKSEFNVGLKNLKLEFVKKLQDKNSSNISKESEHVLVGSVKYKVQSIQNKIVRSEQKFQAIKKVDDQGIDADKKEIVGLVYDDQEVQQELNSKPAQSLTELQFGLSSKQIIVPSFETTAKIFNEHFMILRELRNKIDLLKQAYYGQQDKKKTWEQVDEIIKVLNTGCIYLDFPKDTEVSKYMVSLDNQASGQLENIAEDEEISDVSNKENSVSVDP